MSRRHHSDAVEPIFFGHVQKVSKAELLAELLSWFNSNRCDWACNQFVRGVDTFQLSFMLENIFFACRKSFSLHDAHLASLFSSLFLIQSSNLKTWKNVEVWRLQRAVVELAQKILTLIFLFWDIELEYYKPLNSQTFHFIWFYMHDRSIMSTN